MAKIQTRRSISLSRSAYDATKERAVALGISASQYVHDLIAADLQTAGMTAPDHKPPGDPYKARRAAAAAEEARRRRAMPKADVDRVIGASALVTVPVIARPVRVKAPVKLDCCAWCGELFAEHGTRSPGRVRVGDEHADCGVERARIETKHPRVDNRVTPVELAQRRIA